MSPDKQYDELTRGCAEVLSEKDLKDKLKAGKPLSVKVGFDPTAPDLHLGHTVVLQKMAQFQKLGHKVIFLIGDFTGLVGDPSGKSKTRPQLTRDEVNQNAETYKQQVFKVLDSKKTEIRFNSEWIEKLTAYDFVRLAGHVNVARMLEREDFSKRYKGGQSISLHEFMYPLMQAYDSVYLKTDVELGGTDQKFNLLLGRELMRDHELNPQVCMTLPLLEGLDGVQKMSKSLNNYVGVTDPANDMFGKLMSLPDALLRKYFELLSEQNLEAIDGLFKQLDSGKIHPKALKVQFAKEIVSRYHSDKAAQEAEANFEKIFAKGGLPDDMPEHTVKAEEIWIPKLLTDLKMVKSTSDGKRMVKQGAVKIDQKPITDEKLQAKKDFVLQCGKRQFAKIVVK